MARKLSAYLWSTGVRPRSTEEVIDIVLGARRRKEEPLQPRHSGAQSERTTADRGKSMQPVESADGRFPLATTIEEKREARS